MPLFCKVLDCSEGTFAWFDDEVCRSWLSCGACSSKSLTKEQASKDAIARAEKHAKDMAQLRSGKLAGGPP